MSSFLVVSVCLSQTVLSGQQNPERYSQMLTVYQSHNIFHSIEKHHMKILRKAKNMIFTRVAHQHINVVSYTQNTTYNNLRKPWWFFPPVLTLTKDGRHIFISSHWAEKWSQNIPDIISAIIPWWCYLKTESVVTTAAGPKEDWPETFGGTFCVFHHRNYDLNLVPGWDFFIQNSP